MARPKSPFIILLFALLPAFTSFSQQISSFTTLTQLTDSIQTIVQQEHIAGLMLGITTKDSVLFSGGFGYADLENKRPVNSNTLFRVGSITKMFVSLGIMKLVEEGKLNLYDELKKVAPEVPFKNKWEATDPVRIVHLLEHTSGFDDIKLNRMYSLDSLENHGVEMMMIHKNSMVCRWKPGEWTAYSNPNYAILGFIIEKVTGKSYDRYLSESILDPLGMTNSNFNVRSRLPGKDVEEYVFKNGQNKKVPHVTLLSGPEGALWSCADDMIKFLQLFLNEGDPLFSHHIVHEIETPHSSLAARAGLKTGYALGNRTAFPLAKSPSYRGHDGLIGTCYSGCYYNRDLDIGFVISSNNNINTSRIEDLIVAFLEQTVQKKELAIQLLDKNSIEPFLGYYQFESPRNEILAFYEKLMSLGKIYLTNGELYSKPLLESPWKLVQTAPLTYTWDKMNKALIIFTKDEQGNRIMSIGGVCFRRTSAGWAITKRILVLLVLAFALSSLVSGAISLLRGITGKAPLTEWLPRILPAIGVGALIWAILNLLEVQHYTWLLSELGSINARTLIIFSGTLLFGISSFTSLVYASIRFGKTHNRWYAWYFLVMSLSLCVITTILIQAGWIGLRTWAL